LQAAPGLIGALTTVVGATIAIVLSPWPCLLAIAQQDQACEAQDAITSHRHF
jgi:hypothetical protein